jgi:hypothetical protein
MSNPYGIALNRTPGITLRIVSVTLPQPASVDVTPLAPPRIIDASE